MPIHFLKPDRTRRLQDISSAEEFAGAIGLPLGQLRHHVWHSPYPTRYDAFEIPKRRGGNRQILAPIGPLREIQYRLFDLLVDYYRPPPSVHGFIEGRSILSNAAPHVGKRLVLNLDLRDFFGTLNRGRIFGLFKAAPFAFPSSLAILVADICCIHNSLPQGAPTSPVLANLISKGMDRRLEQLAKANHCTYTRYADDLTFSTDRARFNAALVETNSTTAGRISLGVFLRAIIESEGFVVNDKKVRLAGRHSRQEVTGLTVNDTPNVRRTFVRGINAMLHAWEKYGYESAEQAFWNRGRPPPRSFRLVLRGRLDFLRQVRGADNPTFRRLANRYAKLDPQYAVPDLIRAAHPLVDALSSNLWVLECEDPIEEIIQGTAFHLKGVGLVTCNHVLRPHTRAFRASDPLMKFDIEILWRDETRDLAIVSVPGWPIAGGGLKRGSARNLRELDEVMSVGFPNYSIGSSVSIKPSRVSHSFERMGVKLIGLSGGIVAGMSGGPLLSPDWQVVGVNVTGADREPDIDNAPDQGAIPIDFLPLTLQF